MNTLCWKLWIGRKKGEFHTTKTESWKPGVWKTELKSVCLPVLLSSLTFLYWICSKKKKKKNRLHMKRSCPEGVIQHPGRGCRKNKGNCCPTASPRVTLVVCLKIYVDSRWFFTPASNNRPCPPFPAGRRASEPKPCGLSKGSKDNYREITNPGTSWWQWWEWVPTEWKAESHQDAVN